MNSEKNLEDVAVADERIIEVYAYHFRVASIALTDLFVGWVEDTAAAVTRLYLVNTDELLIHGFSTPKAATTYRCHFHRHSILQFMSQYAGAYLLYRSQ